MSQRAVGFSRDNLDSGSKINPTFESEDADGGDLISVAVSERAAEHCDDVDLIAIQANYSMGEPCTRVTMMRMAAKKPTCVWKHLTTDSGRCHPPRQASYPVADSRPGKEALRR